jgi:hypothetical protein
VMEKWQHGASSGALFTPAEHVQVFPATQASASA